ncbi:MAG: MipA/OmpV family protein [Rhodospirillum sp.]|nr:MipA/OmpV family protein [Rhodospirillum sp.]MCF8489892.1 MipA/OmpV family protein [Rhodospirillum sp.]MCF8502764.1 MipA/OmpV family protein [Rhodospirillum sp.]
MTRASRPKRPIPAGAWFTLTLLVLGTPIAARAEPDIKLGPLDGVTIGAAETPEEPTSDDWDWTLEATLGAGVAAVPLYQGSDEYTAQPLPLVDVTYGPFFAKVGEGIGLNVIDTPMVTAGASVTWMQGYDEDDTPAGIDGLDSAMGARLFVTGRYKGAVATLAATQAVTDTDRGLLVDAKLAYPIHPIERLTIIPSLGATWADERYMDGYFGVNGSEAAASGLGRYEPSAGFKDIDFRLGASYRVTDSIGLIGMVGVTQLVGEAADSPLVEQRTLPFALVGLTYTF